MANYTRIRAVLAMVINQACKSWYVVEARHCTNKNLLALTFPPAPFLGLDRSIIKSEGLSVYPEVGGAVSLQKNGSGYIYIRQIVFDNLTAAVMHYELIKKSGYFRDDVYHKFYVWGPIYARQLKGAVSTFPPSKRPNDARMLSAYPVHGYFDPTRDR